LKFTNASANLFKSITFVIPEKIKTALMREDVIVESMGGNVPSVNVSAKTGKGIPELLDMILLVGEMEALNGL